MNNEHVIKKRVRPVKKLVVQIKIRDDKPPSGCINKLNGMKRNDGTLLNARPYDTRVAMCEPRVDKNRWDQATLEEIEELGPLFYFCNNSKLGPKHPPKEFNLGFRRCSVLNRNDFGLGVNIHVAHVDQFF